MKNGTMYAKRVKRVFSRLKQAAKQSAAPEAADPIEEMMRALLSYETSIAKADRALRALRAQMVDLNEVRVSTIEEIAEVIGRYVPNAAERADEIRRALNAVFRRAHEIRMDSIHSLGRRDAKTFLEQLDGLNAHAVASIMLWSLGGHAIPVNKRLYQRLREHDLIEPDATIEEVQAFLERNISAADAKTFCIAMREFVERPAAAGAVKSGANGRTAGRSKKRTTPKKKTTTEKKRTGKSKK